MPTRNSEKIFAYFSTLLTQMGLLLGVYALVHGEGRSLNELLATSRVRADMRSYAAVNTFYFKSAKYSTWPNKAFFAHHGGPSHFAEQILYGT